MKIFYLEDNPDLLEEVCFQLDQLGHDVTAFGRGFDLRDAVRQGELPDIFLMDLGLPDCDGLELARELRLDHPSVSLILMTARASVLERVDGWQAGADAYLTKPVHLAELNAVISNLNARRSEIGLVHQAEWQLDLLENKLLSPDGASCSLSYSETSLMLALVKANGDPVERDVLVKAMGEKVWDYDMRRLEAAVSRLRKKIREISGDVEADVLRPVRGIGYLFAAKVRTRTD